MTNHVLQLASHVPFQVEHVFLKLYLLDSFEFVLVIELLRILFIEFDEHSEGQPSLFEIILGSVELLSG